MDTLMFMTTWLLLATCAPLLIVHACPVEYNCTCAQVENDYVVDCGSRDLDSIPQSIPHNVTWLNMSHNALGSVDNSSFVNFTNLWILDVSHNVIETVDTLGFEGLGNLQRLDISYNKLQTLDQGLEIFKPVELTIQIIELSNNELHGLQQGLFHRCGVLKSLALANNELTLEHLEAINEPSGITHLDISGNPLGGIPYRFLHQLGAILSLTIRNSSIRSIDPNAFVDIKNSLQTLDLRDNEIKYLKREIFQPMRSSEFNGLTLAANEIVCDCGCKQFQDWLNELDPVIDEATCTDMDGTVYVIKDDDLSQFCKGDDFPDVTPDPDLCTPNSSITLSLLAVDSTTGYIQHHQRALPGGATVYIQLKETDSETVIKNVVSTISDAIHEFDGLKENAGYSVCVVNPKCVVWNCLTFTTTTTNPTLLPVSECDSTALVIGLTIGGCVVCFIIILIVLLLLYNAAIISCYCLTRNKSPNPATYNYNRRRSTKYGATVYSDYQAADDNNYEAIPTRTGSQLSRKYEMPDELPPNPGGLPAGPRDVNPAQLPPKKKPIHFIRDPNFLAQGTSAHGETFLEPRDSSTSDSTGPLAASGNHDRKGIPLPAIPESSVRRKELVEPYLEPTAVSSLDRGWNWSGDPANHGISTIARAQLPAHAQTIWPHYEPQIPKNPHDRHTYLEPTDNTDLDMTLNPNRQTADFTRGVSFKFYNRQESDLTSQPSPDTEHGSFSSGVLLIPSEQDSNGTKDSIAIPTKTGKKKKSKSKKKDRMSLGEVQSDVANRSPTMIPRLEKKRGSIQFTDDIYPHIENEASKV